ncbi:MAG: serine/threonine-protein kinase [Planctomycetota bacterium]
MDCPTTDDLRDLCLGELDTQVEARWLEHIEQCAECQKVVRDFANGSDALRVIYGQKPEIESNLLRKRLAELKSVRPASLPHSSQGFHDLLPWISHRETGIRRVGHWELVRFIGRGGMGIVFEADDLELHRRVAIKLMSPALLIDPRNADRFLREARAAAAINHPSVVSIHAVSKTRDLPFMVMEFVDGESLHQRLMRDPPLEVPTMLHLASQLADGLAAAHAEGVVHRDVKPANVLIESTTGTVKLTDFGLAFSTNQTPLTQAGTLLGTPEYLAPEQITGTLVDHRCDLFSLGTVLHEMATGRTPFQSTSIATTLTAVESKPTQPLVNSNPRIPIWFSDLVTKLHAKSPEQRIADASTVARIIRQQRLDRHDVTRLHEPSKSSRQRRGFGPLPWMIGAAWIAVACMLIVWKPWSTEPRKHQEQVTTGNRVLVAADESTLQKHLKREGDLHIRLTSSSTYRLRPFLIDDRSVHLSAADGIIANIVFLITHDEPGIVCEDAEFTLDQISIRFELPDRLDDQEHQRSQDQSQRVDDSEPLIHCTGGAFVMQRSELISPDRPCLKLIEAECEMVKSRLETDVEAIVVENTIEPLQLVLQRCTLLAATAFYFHRDALSSMQVTDSVVRSDFTMQIKYDMLEVDQVNFDGSGNRFDSERAFLQVTGVPLDIVSESSEQLADRLPILWRGDENTFTGTALMLQDINGTGRTIESTQFLLK